MAAGTNVQLYTLFHTLTKTHKIPLKSDWPNTNAMCITGK